MFTHGEIEELLRSGSDQTAEWGGFLHANERNEMLANLADCHPGIDFEQEWRLIGHVAWMTYEESGQYWLFVGREDELYVLADVYSVMGEHEAPVVPQDMSVTTIADWLECVSTCAEIPSPSW